MYEYALPGCQLDSVMSYLKALGLFRHLSKHTDVRTAWRNDVLLLQTDIPSEKLVETFWSTYIPSPLLSPWNKASGLIPDKKNKGSELIDGILATQDERFQMYRDVIAATKKVMAQVGISQDDDLAAQKGVKKTKLLVELRNRLPDEVLAWFDAVYVIDQSSEISFAPLLGTGANDGRFEFTVNFMDHLLVVFPDHEDNKQSQGWLQDALYGTRTTSLLRDRPVGQFYPGGAGGVNGEVGYTAKSLLNPWDFILMIEGSLVFAGSLARRMGTESRGNATFPFTVYSSAAGYGTAVESEKSRGELWLPAWHAWFSYPVVEKIFSEARVQLGRRRARNGLEFARAIARLGIDHGLGQFHRFSLLERNGLSYLAVHTGTFVVNERAPVQDKIALLDQLDYWLGTLRQQIKKGAPASLEMLVHELEEEQFRYARTPDDHRLVRILRTIGKIEQLISRSKGLQEKIEPAYFLNVDWLAIRDGSPEFRIAAAVASMGQWDKKNLEHQLAIRTDIEGVEYKNGRYVWTDGRRLLDSRDLKQWFGSILVQRIIRYEKQGGFRHDSVLEVPLADVACFLRGELDQAKVVELIWALMTMRWSQKLTRRNMIRRPFDPSVARPYAMLATGFLGDVLSKNGKEEATKTSSSGPKTLPIKVAMLLKAGQIKRACEYAGIRMRQKELRPMAIEFEVNVLQGQSYMAALLIPVCPSEVGYHLQPCVALPASADEKVSRSRTVCLRCQRRFESNKVIKTQNMKIGGTKR